MYMQRKAFSVQVIYDLVILRKDVNAELLYKTCWRIYKESKITDLSNVKVLFTKDGLKNEYYSYDELPEIMKQTVALAVCLIGRWFDALHSGKETILERFKLTCKPTDFWHNSGIFKNDNIKCKNMDELIQRIIGEK